MSGDSDSMWLLLWTIGLHGLWLLFASMDCMDYLDNASHVPFDEWTMVLLYALVMSQLVESMFVLYCIVISYYKCGCS
jgi:hypothetical protein